MAPDAGVLVEVGGAVALAVGVVPEAHRHRGHRPADHELAELADDLVAHRVEGGGVDREAAAGDLAAVDRLQRAALHDPAADVGAAAADVQQDVRPELLVDPVEALRRQRRAGRAELAQAAQVEVGADLETGLAAAHQQRRPGAHQRRPGLLGQPPLRGGVRVLRVPVEHHDRRAQQQRGDERVPHHPGGRREPHQAVAALQVPGQAVVLEVLDQDAAVAVDDRLRQPGGARREQHVERVVERDRLELERTGLGRPRRPRRRSRAARRRRRRGRARGRRARASAARRGSRRPRRGGRSACRRSGSRRSPAAPSARRCRSGRSRCAGRTRARRWPRPRRGWPWRGRRRASRGCSGGTRRRGRPGRRPAAAGPRGRRPPARAGRGRSARRARASARSPARRPRRGPRRAPTMCSA